MKKNKGERDREREGGEAENRKTWGEGGKSLRELTELREVDRGRGERGEARSRGEEVEQRMGGEGKEEKGE